jgi:hypothetical protein
MIYAATVAAVEKVRAAFGCKWTLRCKAAWSSYEEPISHMAPGRRTLVPFACGASASRRD